MSYVYEPSLLLSIASAKHTGVLQTRVVPLAVLHAALFSVNTLAAQVFQNTPPISMQCVLSSKQRKATRKIHPKAARTRMGNTLHDSFPGIALTGKELVMPSPRWQPSPTLFACPASTQTGCSMVPAGTADSRRRYLLATDLGRRCDRRNDALSGSWGLEAHCSQWHAISELHFLG